MSTSQQRFNEFLASFWRDFDHHALRPLQDYLQQYPELAEQVTAEFEDATRFIEDAAGGGPADGEGRQRTIGRYVVQRRLARGGMGLLLLAHDPELGRPVVLKTARGRHVLTAAADIDRLRQEARLTGRLDHEGICPVLDVIGHRGRLFLVLPWVEGDDLSVWIERRRAGAAPDGGPLGAWVQNGDLQPVLRLLEQVAHAVHTAHEAGVVHRDLKPANIKVRPDGQPVVLDFGLAFDSSVDRRDRLTAEGVVLGSPHSMAPEQIEGRLDRIDRRTDVYALGVVLYELLTLRPPFGGGTRTQLLERVLRGEPEPPDRLCPTVPRDVAAVCLKAMAVDPARRYATALEFAADLERVRTLRAPTARPVGRTHVFLRRIRRQPVAAAAIALALCAGVATLLLWIGTRTTAVRAAAATAALRLLEAARSGVAPAAADLQTLRQEFDDERAFQNLVELLRQGNLEQHLQAVLQQMNDQLRGPETAPRARLLSPRAATTDRRPMFRWRGVAGARDTATILLESWGVTATTWQVAIVGDAEVTTELPGDLVLEVGREYRWSVTVPSTADDALTALFRVVDPATLTEIMTKRSLTDDPPWTCLRQAAELLAVGLAADAVSLLTTEPWHDTSSLAFLRTALLAQAYARLDDPAHVRALLR